MYTQYTYYQDLRENRKEPGLSLNQKASKGYLGVL